MRIIVRVTSTVGKTEFAELLKQLVTCNKTTDDKQQKRIHLQSIAFSDTKPRRSEEQIMTKQTSL